MHNWVANAVLREATGNQEASIMLALVPFRSLDLYIDEFAEVMEIIFPYFILMMYVMPLYRTTYSIVHEKVSSIIPL